LQGLETLETEIYKARTHLMDAVSLFNTYFPDAKETEQKQAFWRTLTDDCEGKQFQNEEHLIEAVECLEAFLPLF
jgi:hypothetical protein